MEKPVPSVAKVANAPLETSAKGQDWAMSDVHSDYTVRMIPEEIRSICW